MRRIVPLLMLALPLSTVLAQEHVHSPDMVHAASPQGAGTAPTEVGQSAYAAVAEVVRILMADSGTDWSRVDLEALRRHLADMDDVTLHAAVREADVAGGAQLDVTGTGETSGAIRRMLMEHARALDALPEYAASATTIPGGIRLVVRAEREGDAATAARIRGLGFIGLLTIGAHHQAHHLALARGEPMHH